MDPSTRRAFGVIAQGFGAAQSMLRLRPRADVSVPKWQALTSSRIGLGISNARLGAAGCKSIRADSRSLETYGNGKPNFAKPRFDIPSLRPLLSHAGLGASLAREFPLNVTVCVSASNHSMEFPFAHSGRKDRAALATATRRASPANLRAV